MAKVNKDELGSSRPKLEPDDLDGDGIAIATIATAERIELEDPEKPSGKRISWVLTFHETGDKALWLNATQVGYLIERLGDDTDDWIGQRVPIEPKVSQMGSKRYPKVWVCAPEVWDEALGVLKAKSKAAKKALVAATKKTVRKLAVAKKSKRGR